MSVNGDKGAILGVCCACGYDGEEETPCEVREDETQCNHWWDGPDEQEPAPESKERTT